MDNCLANQKGFSLIEVMVSLTVLVIVALGAGRMLVGSFSALEESKTTLNELSQSQGTAERLMAQSVNSDQPISMGEELNFRFTAPDDSGLEEVEFAVEGGIRETGTGVNVFLPAVPQVNRFVVNPSSHVYGTVPEEITVDIETEKVPADTPVEVQMVSRDDSLELPKIEGTIQQGSSGENNGTQLTIDLQSYQQEVGPGIYDINLWIDELDNEPIGTRDYIVRSIRGVVVGEAGTILTSRSGNTWTYRDQVDINADLNAVTRGGKDRQKIFVTVGDQGIVRKSREGVHWQEFDSFPASLVTQGIDLLGIKWIEEKKQFIITGEQGTIVTGEFNATLGSYEWEIINPNLVEADFNLSDITLKDAAYGGPDGNKKLLVVGNEGHVLIKDDNQWQEKNWGNKGNWNSIGWAQLNPERSFEKKGCFFLAGQQRMRTLQVEDSGAVTIDGNSAQTNVKFKDVFVGEESFFAVGSNSLQETGVCFAYVWQPEDNSWNYNQLEPESEAQKLIDFTAISAYDEQLFILATDNNQQPQILVLEEDWKSAKINGDLPVRASLTDISYIRN